MERSLDKVFNPGSIAVIGASEVPGKAAERRTRSLIQGGYRGDIYLINPKRAELFGRKAYPNVTAVEKEVDLVMIVVAPRFIIPAVTDSIKMGAKGIIIITAGLGESSEEGKKIEAEIMAEANKTGTYVIGPNCSGMFSASSEINLLGVPRLNRGAVSVLAQSGNVIDSLTHYAGVKGAGFSKIISLGNAIGVSFPEYIDYLKDDPDTRAIMIYLEGIKDGNRLIQVARETAKVKPVIALKVGRSKAGARAAASHTGSLAGDDLIVDSAFRQAGIVRVSNVDELFDMAHTFSTCPVPIGDRVAILSEGGGDNSIAADNAETHGMEVPVLSRDTREKMKPFLLEGMPASNPVDYGGTAEENPHMITECVKVCLEDDQVNAAYITGFFGGFKDIIAPHVAELEEQTSRDLLDLVRKTQKPVFVHTSFARQSIKSLDILKQGGIPVFESSERTARCLSALMKFGMNRQKFEAMGPLESEGRELPSVKALFNQVRADKRNSLLETESRDLLESYGMALPPSELARNAQQAAEGAAEIGFPVAMKVVSPDILHKSDAGGVRLHIGNKNAAAAAFDEILENALKLTSRERISGVMISPMVPKGQECIAGMIRDSQFGPVIMFGLGGIFVEVLRDVSFRVAPLGPRDVDEMTREIKGYKILEGIRGEGPKDVSAIREILARINEIALGNPEIRELDLNPVIVHEKGASIVDSRIILTSEE